VKEGKAKSYEGSGFGGKGLERLDQERQAKDIAQRTAYGEAPEEKPVTGSDDKDEEGAADAVFDFKVEIKRGPAPASRTARLRFLSHWLRRQKRMSAERLLRSKLRKKLHRRLARILVHSVRPRASLPS